MPKNKTQKKESQKKNSFARNVNALLSGKFLTREYVLSNLGFIFFCVLAMVCYIGYGYYAEKNLKELAKSESDLQELKARNLSTHARLEQLKQQSHVAQSIKALGLVESTEPPVVLRKADESENQIEVNE